ncbi:unnamed protein product [Gadus morhua 'NCC']
MISHNRSQRGLQGTLGSVLTYLFSSYVYAQMDIQSHAGTFFDDCRYRCVMMSYGREQGRGGMIKGTREGMKRQKRISKTNNGTKMATASTTGRATALRPPDHLQEPFSSPGRLVHGCHSNKLVMTYWNHQVILSRPRRHRQRRANMVNITMETLSIQKWIKVLKAWTLPEPPDPDSTWIRSNLLELNAAD